MIKKTCSSSIVAAGSKTRRIGLRIVEVRYPPLGTDGIEVTLHVTRRSKQIGYFCVSWSLDSRVVYTSSVQLYKHKNEGIGTIIYTRYARRVEACGHVLHSDYGLSEDAENLWKGLIRRGLAIDLGDRYRFLTKAERRRQ